MGATLPLIACDVPHGMLLETISVTAISRLRVIANWDGLNARSESSTAVYNPPPGFVIIGNQVEVHSSNNGGREVSTLAGGLNLVIESDLNEVYDSAIDFAGAKNDDSLKARLEDKKALHVSELRRYSTNQNTIVATVKARAHGSFVDRKRGWEEISVIATLIRLGAPGKQDTSASLEEEFSINIPDDFRRLPSGIGALPIFDADLYLGLYKDLKEAFGQNEIAARDHWLRNGITEGRRGSAEFDSVFYLEQNPDVRNSVGAGNYIGAVRHYLDYGRSEGRQGSPVFNNGIAEPPIFDAGFYLNKYQDMKDAFGDNTDSARDHWLRNGISEGRSASADFDPVFYLDQNEDVRNAFGASNFYGAIIHYLNNGRTEGRRGSP